MSDFNENPPNTTECVAPDAHARLHGDDAFDGHRQIDDDAVALLDGASLQRVGQTAYAFEQILIRDVGDGAIVGFEDNRGVVAAARFDATVETIVRHIEFAVLEPLVERRARFIQYLAERLVSREILAREPRPEAFVVALFAWIFLKKKPSGRAFASIARAMAGVLVINVAQAGDSMN